MRSTHLKSAPGRKRLILTNEIAYRGHPLSLFGSGQLFPSPIGSGPGRRDNVFRLVFDRWREAFLKTGQMAYLFALQACCDDIGDRCGKASNQAGNTREMPEGSRGHIFLRDSDDTGRKGQPPSERNIREEAGTANCGKKMVPWHPASLCATFFAHSTI
ncbi:MAG: hypothetical protein V2G42_07890 [bacterium JZ-2024 1]